MKRTIRMHVLPLVIICLFAFVPANASAEMSKGLKIGLGVGLVAGGVGLGTHAAKNAFCFDCSVEAEFFAGLAMVGVGTVLIIKGIKHKEKSENRQKLQNSIPPEKDSAEILFGAGRARKGWAATMRIRW